MNSSAGAVAFKLCHLHYLINHTLAGDSRISVYQDRKYFAVISLVSSVLFGTGDSFNHGTHRFQVRRVGSYIYIDAISVIGNAAGSPSKMVFHIPVKNILLIILAFEFTKNVLGTFPKNIG